MNSSGEEEQQDGTGRWWRVQRRCWVGVFVGLILTSIYFYHSDEKSVEKFHEPKIVDGQVMTESDRLHNPRSSALLLIQKTQYKKSKSRCTSNVISSNTLVTAAHCFDKPTSPGSYHRIDIYVGITDFKNFILDESQRHQQFILHEDYINYDKRNDTWPVDPKRSINEPGVYVHPAWSQDVNYGYDIAIIKLDTRDRVQFNEYSVNQLDLKDV